MSRRRSSRSSDDDGKRVASELYEPEVIQGIEELNNDYSRKIFKISKDELKNQKDLAMTGTDFPKPSVKETDSFYKMSPDQRNKCNRLVVRVLLMKAARNEPLTRAIVADVLGSFDPTYKKHVSVLLLQAKEELKSKFGYNLLCGTQVTLNGKKDEFYLVNDLDSPTLYAVLAESKKKNDKSFVGFVYIILQIIFSSPGRKCDVRTLLRNIRKIDNRFPEMVVKKDKSGPIAELEGDFLTLLARMKKEGYITTDKVTYSYNLILVVRHPNLYSLFQLLFTISSDDFSTYLLTYSLFKKDSLDEVDNDSNKIVYTFGTRFFSDFGLITLLRSHSQASGEIIDAKTLKDLEEEITQQRVNTDAEGIGSQ